MLTCYAETRLYHMIYNHCSPAYVRANRVECAICQSPPTPGALYTISRYEYTEHAGRVHYIVFTSVQALGTVRVVDCRCHTIHYVMCRMLICYCRDRVLQL